MNEVRIKTKSPDIGVKPRAKQVQRERRAEAKLANEIIMKRGEHIHGAS